MDSNLNIPKHVAIIMDGNGRWAAKQGRERLWGHSHGVESLHSVVEKSVSLGIRYLTIYAFSTENWGRPDDEVSGLMSLLASSISKETKKLADSGIRMKFIGNISGLSKNLQEIIKAAENVPIENIKMTLAIALNYSSRWEITEAVKKIVVSGVKAEDITERTISENLATADMPEPDFLIRTSGEIRLSNFLLWQLSYSELYFTDTLWPDFDGNALEDAIKHYSKRERRWGKL